MARLTAAAFNRTILELKYPGAGGTVTDGFLLIAQYLN